MGIILKCCNKWNSGRCKKCLKFYPTTTAYAVVLFIVLFVVYDFYTFGAKYNNVLLYGYITAIVIMLISCFLLFFGLKYEKTYLLSTWIVIMTMFWNIHLAVGIVSIVNDIVDREEQLAQTLVRCIVLIIVQAVWLLGIVLIWCYWRTLKKLRDDTPAANVVEFIPERASSLPIATSGEVTAEPKVALPTEQRKEQVQEQTISPKSLEQSKEQRNKEEEREQTTSRQRTKHQSDEQRNNKGREPAIGGEGSDPLKEQIRTRQSREQRTEQSKEQRTDQGQEQMTNTCCIIL